MNKKIDIDVHHYVCALIDVLGQQELLRELDRDDHFHDIGSTGSSPSFRAILEDCYATVINVRKIIEKNLAHWSANIEDLHNLNSQQQQHILQATKPRVSFRSFSDLVVAYASVDNQDTRVPLAPIWALVCALMFCQFRALAEGKVLRGGIDLGLGFEFGEGDVYGPVLARVYTLESEVAQYPRIIVGKRLLEYVQSVAVQNCVAEYDFLNATMARNLERAFVVDVDGQVMLDFAGQCAYEWFRCDVWKDAAQLFERSLAFLHSECGRFQDKKNSKLAFRYLNLLQYMLSRQNVWKSGELANG